MVNSVYVWSGGVYLAKEFYFLEKYGTLPPAGVLLVLLQARWSCPEIVFIHPYSSISSASIRKELVF